MAQTPQTPITEAELATRSGSTPELTRRMVELGIVRTRPGDRFQMTDVLRVRLARALESSGIDLGDLGRGIAAGHVSFDFADDAMTAPISLMDKSYRQLAAELGLSDAMLEGLRSALGTSRASPDEPIREDDAEMLGMAAFGLSIGLSDHSLLRFLRVFNENMRRAVEYELELFRNEIEHPLLDAGMSEQQMLQQMALLRGRLEPFSGRLAALLHRRQEEHALFQDVIEHVENTLDRVGLARRRTPRPPTIALLEVSGYTRLVEGGEDYPSDYPVRLGDLSQEALAYTGRPVSILADVVMLHFTEPVPAVRCCLHLIDRIKQVGLPARVGMHAGPVVIRDGEYFGRTVNVATRITDYARPGEVLVSSAVVEAAGPDSIQFEQIGPVTLRGLVGAVDLYLATAPRGDGPG